MKVCVIQPGYSTEYSRSDEYFEKELAMLAECDESMDLIVLPEMADIPCLAFSREESEASAKKYNKRLMEAIAQTARRCHAMVFVNARDYLESGLRNTTFAFNREGEIVGKYDKQHLTPGEVSRIALDSDYSFTYSAPTVVEMEGLRFGFLTCYDFYFYESFANMARQDLDIVIGCSHQRSDTHEALKIMSQFLAYNTNTYVVRASVSMGEDSPTGGASMVVSPTGEVLCNLYSKVGLATVEIDPKAKYYKPAGFGNPPSAHYEYIEKGRRPWKYRPSGPAIVRPDAIMPYPRVCAHRGFNTVAPENSLPAFASAIALGAPEIEFDVWFSKDGVPISIHDPTLHRVSNGTGHVWDYTLEELKAFDFGVKQDHYAGLQIPTLEEILQKFACHCIMNIHLKTEGDRPEYLDRVVKLIKQYDCEQYVYFMSGEDALLARLQAEYPEITRCCGAGDKPWEIVERAIQYGCKKVQFYHGRFHREMVDKARANGLICNVYHAETPAEAQAYLDMGIDVILTNDYFTISKSL